MYSIRDVNRKEKNTDKGHNSLIKYGEFKNTHFNKEAIRHKMRETSVKNMIQLLMRVIKDPYLILMISIIFFLME